MSICFMLGAAWVLFPGLLLGRVDSGIVLGLVVDTELWSGVRRALCHMEGYTFHMTCMHATGVLLLEPENWPYDMAITCLKYQAGGHTMSSPGSLTPPSPPTTILPAPMMPCLTPTYCSYRSSGCVPGQVVITKNCNGLYYHCHVISTTMEFFYEMNFDKGEGVTVEHQYQKASPWPQTCRLVLLHGHVGALAKGELVELQ